MKQKLNTPLTILPVSFSHTLETLHQMKVTCSHSISSAALFLLFQTIALLMEEALL